MSFKDTPILNPYIRNSVHSETKLYVSTLEEVENLEAALKVSFPIGYKEYVTTLGFGEYCDFIRVDMPSQILEGYQDYQKFLDEYYFWELGEDIITKQRAIESIKIADTDHGDVIIFHPTQPDELYILPHEDDLPYYIGNTFYKAIDWLCSCPEGVGEIHDKRYFVPWNKDKLHQAKIWVEAEDWEHEIKVSKEIFEPALILKILKTYSNNEQNYSYDISNSIFAQSPSWNPETSEPPLSIHQAILIARKELPRFVENSDKLALIEISLQQFGENNWCYVILFQNLNFDGGSEYFQIFVMMDGQIIAPKEIGNKNCSGTKIKLI